MPTETGRTWGKVPVRMPNGKTVNVRVVTDISFLDPVNRAQETRYTIINKLGDGQANRTVHIDTITGTGQSLLVERIDTFRILDPVDRAQETHISMDNITGSDTTPPSFVTHLKTHKTKFYAGNDSNTFLQTEWIDEFVVLDPVDRAQETHYYVTGNPPDDAASAAQADDPDVSGDLEGNNGLPIRTDPFQNLVSMGTSQDLQYFYVDVDAAFIPCTRDFVVANGGFLPVGTPGQNGVYQGEAGPYITRSKVWDRYMANIGFPASANLPSDGFCDIESLTVIYGAAGAADRISWTQQYIGSPNFLMWFGTIPNQRSWHRPVSGHPDWHGPYQYFFFASTFITNDLSGIPL